MAYETGISTSLNDLLDKIRLFAIAQGFTQNEFTVVDSTTKRLYMQKSTSGGGGLTFHFGIESFVNASVTVTELRIRGATGYTPGAALNLQPGAPSQSAIMDFVGNGPYVAYHLFSNAAGDYVHCVLEYSAGFFSHLVFGQLDKFGTYAGGHYCDAVNVGTNTNDRSSYQATTSRTLFDNTGVSSASKGQVSANLELNVWRMFAASTDSPTTFDAYGNGRFGLTSRLLVGSQPNTLNLATPFIPIYIFTDIGGTNSGNRTPLGVVKDLRLVWLQSFPVGQEVTLGPDTWKVFPITRRSNQANTQDQLPNSWQLGYAYRKIA